MRKFPTIVANALRRAGFEPDEKADPAINFLNALEDCLAKGKTCVVLIDEYDDPVARALKILFWSQGLEVVTEDTQSAGRADVVVKYRKAIYVFELKRDGTAAEALAQIREKDYEKPYLADGRPVFLIGLAFDDEVRRDVSVSAACVYIGRLSLRSRRFCGCGRDRRLPNFAIRKVRQAAWLT